MANRFSKGLYPISQSTSLEASPRVSSASNELLLLILLFVLLAASPSLGVDSSYFFVIIMAVIGLGGVKKAFGLSS